LPGETRTAGKPVKAAAATYAEIAAAPEKRSLLIKEGTQRSASTAKATAKAKPKGAGEGTSKRNEWNLVSNKKKRRDENSSGKSAVKSSEKNEGKARKMAVTAAKPSLKL